jgi:ribosomal protein S18 acetylase RimI-like enzyme
MGSAAPTEVVVGLPDEARVDAERLLALCNRCEGLDLPIFLDPTSPAAGVATYFLSYEGGALVGLAWLPDDGEESEPEGCLMVHPGHRRRGVGRALIAAMRHEARRRGLPGFLLVCDQAASSGTAFLAAVGARYRASEYRLELDPGTIDRSRPRHPALRLRPAGADEAETLVRLQAASFGDATDDVRERIAHGLRDPNRRYYLGELDGEPVGLLRTGEWEGFADITAFGVLPAHRGRGYGRQLLLDAVDLLVAEGRRRILIEVATDNEGALGLYRSCGFAVKTAYGFYELAA